MVLMVGLQCCKCYNKIKKLLAEFPEITKTPEYDIKNNKVTIKVKTDNLEKFRNKLLCKGCKMIKCIIIVPPPKQEPPKEPPKKEPPKQEPRTVVIEANICLVCGRPSCGGCGGGPCDHGCKRPGPCNEKCCGSCPWGCGGGTCCKGCGKSVPCGEQCCGPCSRGCGGGTCCKGCGRSVPCGEECCVPCYQGCGRSEPCYGHGYVCGCGCGGRGYCARGCHENSQGCTMM
ncbi:Receptor protein-tyrosine kinase [Bertholletia excelsa]